MIRFACPGCSTAFTVTDDKAGKTSNCPKCRTLFQIPELDPAPAPPQPSSAAPRSRPVDDDEDDRPRRRPTRGDDNEHDDRPRRRSRREDDEEDRPRSRSRRDDFDDDDDRPRRRREDDYDDDDDRPRRKPKKAPKRSGMILAAGIVCLVGAIAALVFAIMDASNRLSGASNFGRMNAMTNRGLSKEQQSALSQIETAFVFLQISIYSSFGVAVGMLAAGIGLVIHMTWARIATFITGGIAVLCSLAMLIFLILLATTSVNGKSVPMENEFVIGNIARMLVFIGPMVFATIVILNSAYTRFLRMKL